MNTSNFCTLFILLGWEARNLPMSTFFNMNDCNSVSALLLAMGSAMGWVSGKLEGKNESLDREEGNSGFVNVTFCFLYTH